jgi:ABC-type nitrate/sulfonate/bicarbonate transport system ATPase subunit
MQRVAIGRALVREPAIYLMDEPLSSLDAKLRAELRLELKRIQTDLGATILYVTHDQTEAMTMADRIGVIDRPGRLIADRHAARDLRVRFRWSSTIRLYFDQAGNRWRPTNCGGTHDDRSRGAQTACLKPWRSGSLPAPTS